MITVGTRVVSKLGNLDTSVEEKWDRSENIEIINTIKEEQ